MLLEVFNLQYEYYTMQNVKSMSDETNTRISHIQKVGLTIRALRNLLGLSQSEMAKLAMVSRPTISILEKGDILTNANVDTLEKLLSVFKDMGVAIQINEDSMTYSISKEAMDHALKTPKK